MGLLRKDKSLKDVLDEIVKDEDARLIIEHKVMGIKKEKFASKVSELFSNGEDLPESLKVLVEDIQKHFT